MLIKFYCDLHGPLPIRHIDHDFTACTTPGSAVGPGITRVAFEVAFPDSLVCEQDVIVPAAFIARQP